MAVSVLLVAWNALRGGWRYVWMGGGVVCAAKGTGTTAVPMLCVGSWDTQPLVCMQVYSEATFTPTHMNTQAQVIHIHTIFGVSPALTRCVV